jgi:hypothetical protein
VADSAGSSQPVSIYIYVHDDFKCIFTNMLWWVMHRFQLNASDNNARPIIPHELVLILIVFY